MWVLFAYFFLIGPLNVIGAWSKNKNHNDACFKEIGSYLQVLINYLHTQKWTLFGGYVYKVKEPNKCALPTNITKYNWFDFQYDICWCFIIDLLT